MSGKRMKDTLCSIVKSWYTTESPLCCTQELLDWIYECNTRTDVQIQKIPLESCGDWFYDNVEGHVRNSSRTFFSVTGYQEATPDGILQAQPVMIQNEISYLGIICQEINSVMHFLMQAKIEPGNVNCVQISPTIQATKSNFMQKHGGKAPPYLEYFLNAAKYEVVVDQIQSEQSSRFCKKRNRNILLRVDKEIRVLPTHRWMTLGQIKALMRYDNLVNMDTRTVLSCIPFSRMHLSESELLELSGGFQDKPLCCSVFVGDKENHLPEVYQYINNFKMFSESRAAFLPLHELRDWEWRNGEFVCKTPWPFKLIFCDIAIEGREVRSWSQPLFEATGIATFGLLCCEADGMRKFVVRATPELGCFDRLELGPTVQREAVPLSQREDSAVDRLFEEHLRSGEGVLFDHLLSEEGGRFYHEQNRNVLLRVRQEELPPLPEGYFLLDYRTLNELVQVNNTLNIQLRNLLSLLGA